MDPRPGPQIFAYIIMFKFVFDLIYSIDQFSLRWDGYIEVLLDAL